MKEIKAKRLILRTWTKEDMVPFAKMNADPKVMECFPAPLTREESDAFYERIKEHFDKYGWGLWAVSVKKGPKFIGYIGLKHVLPSLPCAPAVEIGWRLISEEWGKGYATEGAKAALEYGFNKADLVEIVSLTAKINTRSINVMEKIGMRRDIRDDFEHPLLSEGDPLRSHVLYRLLRSQYHIQQANCE